MPKTRREIKERSFSSAIDSREMSASAVRITGFQLTAAGSPSTFRSASRAEMMQSKYPWKRASSKLTLVSVAKARKNSNG